MNHVILCLGIFQRMFSFVTRINRRQGLSSKRRHRGAVFLGHKRMSENRRQIADSQGSGYPDRSDASAFRWPSVDQAESKLLETRRLCFPFSSFLDGRIRQQFRQRVAAVEPVGQVPVRRFWGRTLRRRQSLRFGQTRPSLQRHQSSTNRFGSRRFQKFAACQSDSHHFHLLEPHTAESDRGCWSRDRFGGSRRVELHARGAAHVSRLHGTQRIGIRSRCLLEQHEWNVPGADKNKMAESGPYGGHVSTSQIRWWRVVSSLRYGPSCSNVGSQWIVGGWSRSYSHHQRIPVDPNGRQCNNIGPSETASRVGCCDGLQIGWSSG